MGTNIRFGRITVTVSLLALNHSAMLSRSFCMWEHSLDGFEAENNKQVSSAKSRGIQLTNDGKSLMYTGIIRIVRVKGLNLEQPQSHCIEKKTRGY